MTSPTYTQEAVEQAAGKALRILVQALMEIRARARVSNENAIAGIADRALKDVGVG